MMPAEIKAKAIEAAARTICGESFGEIPPSVVTLATAAIAAYERAMIRPLADAPPMPTTGRWMDRVLIFVPVTGEWVDGCVKNDPDEGPIAIRPYPYSVTTDAMWRPYPDVPSPEML